MARSRRGILAPVPTAYLEPAGPIDESVETAVRADRPTVRAAARAIQTTRLDAKGHAVLSQAPTSYIDVARDSSQESIVSSPIQRAERASRRDRIESPPIAPRTLIEHSAEDEAVETTRRVVGRGRRAPATARLRRLNRDHDRVGQPGTRWVRTPERRTRPVSSLSQRLPKIEAAPTARAASRRSAQSRPGQRSTLSRAVNRSDLQYLVADEIRQIGVEFGLQRVPDPSGLGRARGPESGLQRRPGRFGPGRGVATGQSAPDRTAPGVADIREPPRREPPSESPSLRTLLQTVAPVVRASNRIGRSLVTVSAARRAVGDARGRRPTVFARLQESPQGRIVRGEARRSTGPGRAVSAPETVVVGASDFGPAVDRPVELTARGRSSRPAAGPVEWSESRLVGRSRPAGTSTRIPAIRAAERIEGPGRFAAGRPGRTVRTAAGRFTPPTRTPAVADVTVAAPVGATPAVQGATPAVPSAIERRRPGRALDQTWGYLDPTRGAARTRAATGRPATGATRRRGASVADSASVLDSAAPIAEPSVLDSAGIEPTFEGDPYEPRRSLAPGWARRAVDGTAVAPAPQLRPQSRARVGGSLLTALARAANPEDVVQVILERSLSGIAGELPGPAAQLVRRIAKTADVGAASIQPRQRDIRGAQGDTSARRRGGPSVRRSVLQPRRSRYSSTAPAQSTVRTGQGVGASGVMKLANKLMKLIHLAENERRAEARSQVRMAEDTAQARAEGGLGASVAKSEESETMNIQTLQQEVLESVLSAIELIQQRREGDPDGRNEWW